MARLEAMIGEDGPDAFLARVMTRVAEGVSPRDISASMGVPWIAMRKWLEAEPKRMSEWELAKRCFADGLVWEGLEAARNADSESVGVSKLRAEHYTKIAEKMSRQEWGNRQELVVTHEVSVLDALEEARRRVVESRVPVTIENSVEVL